MSADDAEPVLLEGLLRRHGIQTFADLHAWSIEHTDAFWREAWADLGIVGDPGAVTSEGDGFLGTRWFPEAHLNVVDTLLAGSVDDVAIVAFDEDGSRHELTRGELRVEVAACAAALRAEGVGPGDRVAAWMPNVIETVVFALGALSLGAVVSTASPDFGPAALLDRFGQIEPTVLLLTSGYRYGGRWFDTATVRGEITSGLADVRRVVESSDWDAWLAPWRGTELTTTPLPFDHPGFVLFSSGTTGRPKAIIHSAAGVLLKDASEQGYHLDIRAGDRVLYYTTCGWMMWNWLVMALARQATIVLADGSPGGDRLWSIAAAERLTFLGVSAALIDSWRRSGLRPADEYDLPTLRTMASTGSPLSPAGFDWVAEAVSSQVHLASISGGTDLCGCFVLGVCTEPVHRGEIQGAALGLDVTVLRADGSIADVDETGELVCRTPFPSVPLGFVGDSDRTRITESYFARFPETWAHGDHARRTASGGFEILGRSDATLNAKGVRIGTAEIYRVVTALPGVVEALAVAQDHEGDSRVLLFVLMAPGVALDVEREQQIRAALRTQASPRHVPAVIAAAPDLPRTRSGKLAELAVADIVNGRPVRGVEGLANPSALDWFGQWSTSLTPEAEPSSSRG